MKELIKKLKEEFGEDIRVEENIKLHDERGYNYSNKYTITFKNIIVGSELVEYDFIRNNVLELINKG